MTPHRKTACANACSRVVLDFDGTCTQIPPSFEDYLDHFGRAFVNAYEHLAEDELDPSIGEKFGPMTNKHWQNAMDVVRSNSPRAGWTVAGCPAAPAAADPYILADESAKYIFRSRRQKSLPRSFHEEAYSRFPAPWREEATEVFSRLVERGATVFFVSNSSTVMIEKRIEELYDQRPELRGHLFVQSDAGKFRVCEPQWDRVPQVSAGSHIAFAALPAATACPEETVRPVYLRRGAYLEAIDTVLDGKIELISKTVFCGDIWEMDLAMPSSLGAKVHLIDRASPFDTYKYERQAIKACGSSGRNSCNLTGLLEWFE